MLFISLEGVSSTNKANLKVTDLESVLNFVKQAMMIYALVRSLIEVSVATRCISISSIEFSVMII